MADMDWKKRVGVNINYNSDSDGESTNVITEEKNGDTSPEIEGKVGQNSSAESSLDAILHKYEQYGSTPPRTRLSRHMRDWKRKEKEVDRKENPPQIKMARRNTFDAMYLDNSDIAESDSEQPPERICKRFMKMLRGSERDMKLDLTHSPDIHSFSVDSGVDRADRAESVPLGTQPVMKVESSNRFMSLTSKLVACHNVKKMKHQFLSSMNSRQELYNLLLPFRSGPENIPDKLATRQLSNEEFRWQNELKDLIWLELQAWHASRSLNDQDEYLCKAREEVEKLLHDIMVYRFDCDLTTHPHYNEACDTGRCLSMYCEFCIEKQNTAIREIERLSNRLEQAESLFSSSKNFANTYPLYKDEHFTARVKSMCLWLNMTKQHRLKMLILGKLFISRTAQACLWPGPAPMLGPTDTDSGVGSTNGTNTEGEQDSPPVEESHRKKLEWKPSVRFDTEYTGSSPSDSASSASSQSIYEMPDVVDYSSALATISQTICPHKRDKSSPYRLFIEEVLKTKGLRKSVRFLERLHRYTLVRSCVTLEKPSEIPITDDKPFECAHEEELRRHGFYSQEMQEIGLPSYHSSFLFLARIPLRLIHEYLDMRLEQQPEKPSDLCLRQLMRELKEGLRLAVLFRERFTFLIIHAFRDVTLDHDLYEDVHELDKSSRSVFQIYLDYLQRWCHLVEQESYQKSLLDEEWIFAKQVATQIPSGVSMVAGKFCTISKTMLRNLGDMLTDQINGLTKPLCDSGDDCKDQVTKQSILTLCRELQCVFNDMRERFLKAFNFTKTLKKDVEAMGSEYHSCLDALKDEALHLCKIIKLAMVSVENTWCITDSLDIDAMENEAVQATIRETLHQGYKFGFEYHKEVCKNVTGEIKPCVPKVLLGFALMWMNFVKQRCERGRGMRPRWANQGLDYLLIVCDTENTQYLAETEFEELKMRVQDVTQHIIGNFQPDPIKDIRTADSSRANSPTPRPRFRLPRSPHDGNVRLQTPTRKSSINTPSDGSVDSPSPQERKNVLLYVCPKSRMERVRSSVDNLERNVDHKLRTQNLIGYVTAVHKEDRVHIRLRQVNFSWQRGIKIGQGSFGKVYTAVNNQTGELMAMKEVQLQPNDHRTIKKIAQELAIFEGIQHKHLVRYYGVEIHRDEMLIFMEFCEEGTLETLVAATSNGLPEPLVRRFTLQLMQAVQTLHCHGIVHRDIKSANIFLTDEGNCLKLGDFGSAVKIKAHTTMPGELQGFVGTQAYMAPEVFTKMHTEGHGRAVDIWSIGCVVVEMASGKRPWAELDSNYQVMFKVGMGESPAIPPSLSDEGYDFVDHCLQHDPQQRYTAADLLQHTFLKVDGEEPLLSLLPSIIDDYGHFGNTKA
ncbi:hypothetical protein FOCC_FOCC000930 [Frankliniella occidentalis]|uniref:Mitogen-activated protein kinase kinase kinase 4 n=1 Tax=Frankliniella occidentalis TaxID=133901 RepID=A0A6J1T8K2_FRAOC|nr:mitogen-activated protein kinase kinase kinase 4 [Frankliniella occidentalis]KAE8752458.1 hypothetical protein FOCC_FOCC000930 [Frankliniella occidentalis]